MTETRPFEERDLSEVAVLFPRFRETFLGNPWADASLPSWVARDGGRIVGAVGVMPRPMRLHGKPVRAAVLTHYGSAAKELVRAALSGPQDLALSDSADDGQRRAWEASGGSTVTLYGLQWRRLLRPASCALGMLPGVAGRAAAMAAAPMAMAADAYMTRRMGLGRKSTLAEQPLTGASLSNALEVFGSSYRLRPRYNPATLEWLLAQARAKRGGGELQAHILRQGGRVAGWFLYYLNSGTSKVLQLAARPGCEDAVLAHLFEHAWRRGSRAIEGRMEPRFARELSRQHCSFLQPNVFVVAHARDGEVLGALGTGNAFFSRLEGDYWMRSLGETQAANPRPALPQRFWTRVRPQPVIS
jgi:hypothetical protein